MRTTCGHPRRQPRAGTRNAPVDPAPPVRRGARPGARVERRIVWRMRRTSGTCPLREGRSRTGIRDVTILFDTVATLKACHLRLGYGARPCCNARAARGGLSTHGHHTSSHVPVRTGGRANPPSDFL